MQDYLKTDSPASDLFQRVFLRYFATRNVNVYRNIQRNLISRVRRARLIFSLELNEQNESAV